MKVDDFFRVGGKTIFAGDLQTDEEYISGSTCLLKVGEDTLDEIEIAGEVSSHTGYRDLWTLSVITLDRASIHGKDVWLISTIATDATLAGRSAPDLGGGPFRVSVLEKTFGARFGSPSSISDISKTMSSAGFGARGIVFGSRADGAVGHVFNVVNQKGVVRFLDGQTGRAASLDGFESFQLLRTN